MEVADLADDPLLQLVSWVEAARQAGEPMPEAVCVATAGSDGAPSARMVLLRGVDTGLVFYTDYGSDKAVDLRANGRAAMVLHYHRPVHRQARVSGAVERTSAEESDRYWATRPVASRRSAIASHQSSVIAGRAELEQAVAALAGDEDPARPARWGGYRLIPDVVELWEEGPDRLHDRLRYRRDAVAGGWRIERLAP